MTTSSSTVAAAFVDFIHPDGRRVPGRIWLGHPYQVDELEAKCACGMDGFDRPLRGASGNDTFQALMLAARSLAIQLTSFIDNGGRIVHPGTDEPFELEPYFDTLSRHPPFS